MTPEEIEKKQQDENQREFESVLFKVTKKFATGARLHFGEGFFALRFYFGDENDTVAFTPQTAKRLRNIFTNFVENYEKQFGSIQIDYPQISPIQIETKQNPPEEQDDKGTKE